MRSLVLIAGGALLLAANVAAAQPMPAGHAEHHGTRGGSRYAAGKHCCCEHEMHEMMSMMHQMMKMHRGMKMEEKSGMSMPTPNPSDQDHST